MKHITCLDGELMMEIWTGLCSVSVSLSLAVEDKHFYLRVIEDYSFIQALHLSEIYVHCSHSRACEDQFLVAEGSFIWAV